MTLTRRKIDLSRFKRTAQGYKEFASILEQSDPKNRDRIIEDVQRDDPDFLADVMKKVIYFEDLTALDEGILSEILYKISPKLLAYALRGMPEEFRKTVLGHLNHVGLREVMYEEEILPQLADNNFILGARKQIIKIARDLESQGKFELESPRAAAARDRKKRRTGTETP